MISFDFYELFYDVVAYMVAFRALLDEILYKFGYKRRIDVKKDLPSNLCGHVAIVTGGTRGIGLTTVRSLLSKGCFVFVASSQGPNKFAQLLDKIYKDLPAQDKETGVQRGTARLHNLDLSSIMFAPRKLTVDGFESHLAVNYLGHCLLITELLPELRKGAQVTKTNSRIVSVASSTHQITRFKYEDIFGEIDYSSSQAYAQSKLAQIMFTRKLSRILKQSFKWDDVQCISIHPGVILSDLYEHVKLIQIFPFLIPLIRLVTRDLVQGAETTLFAALSPELDNHSGAYLEDCTVKMPSKRATNETDQDRLWELTFHLLSRWTQTKETTEGNRSALKSGDGFLFNL